MPTNLFDPTIQGLADALSLHQRRHQVLASNVANIETPGFRAQELDFKGALEAAFQKDQPAGAGVAAGSARVITDLAGPVSADGNSVDVDLQMAKLAANSGRYNTLAKILGKRFGLLRQSIDGVR